MAQINSPRKTRSGKVLSGVGVTLADVEMATVEEIIGRETAEDVIDLTEDYIDVDAYEDVTEVNNDGNTLENRTTMEVIVEDDDNVTIIADGNEDGISENGLNVNHSFIDDLNLTVNLNSSPSSSGACSSTSASSSACASTAPSNGSGSVSCRICLDSQSDLEKDGHHLLSTVCGHIFCSQCLPNVIKKRGLCPICRRVLRPKDFHQIFF